MKMVYDGILLAIGKKAPENRITNTMGFLIRRVVSLITDRQPEGRTVVRVLRMEQIFQFISLAMINWIKKN